MTAPPAPHHEGMLPLDLPGVIACQVCSATRADLCTDSDARALGWRVWRGTTLTGDTAHAVLCPSCAAGTGPS